MRCMSLHSNLPLPDGLRLPVFVVTGFLGSGKTTLLNALLPHYPDSALVINELGEQGIDDTLLVQHGVPMSLLAGGCLCCTVKGSLTSTLRNLWMARRAGDVPAFSRVVIETTGAADPWGVIETLTRDRFLARHYRPAACVTTVDARAGMAALRRHPEALGQVLVADYLVLTRANEVDNETRDGLQAALMTLNPAATVTPFAPGMELPPLLDDVVTRARCRITGMLQPATSQSRPGPVLPTHAQVTSLRAASARLSQPLVHAVLMQALEQWLGEQGAHLMRFKGLFNTGESAPLLVQAMATGMDEPQKLGVWPGDDHDSRMVLIADHPDPEFASLQLARLLEALRTS